MKKKVIITICCCLILGFCVNSIQTYIIIKLRTDAIANQVIYENVVNERDELKAKYEREASFEFEAHLPDYMTLMVRVDYSNDYPMNDLKERVIKHSMIESINRPIHWNKIKGIREDALKVAAVAESIYNSSDYPKPEIVEIPDK